MYQSKFHPINPSLISTCDGSGKFDLWDLNVTNESPILSKKISNNPINKHSWSDDGKRIAMGDSQGKVYLYVGDRSIVESSAEDSYKFESVINQYQNEKQGFII